MATMTATASTAVKPGTALKPGTRVTLVSDIPGVAAGATGKVVMVEGLTWVRYWVAFDDGPRVGTIGRNKLATAEEWERRTSGATATAVAVAAAPVETAAAPAAASTGGVPQHLLERAQKARERAAAKKAAEG